VNGTSLLVKALRNPRKALSVLRHHVLSAFGHSEFRRYIVLSRSRAGSNLLVSFLNSHPGILAEGEILGALGSRDCRDVLAKAWARQPHYIRAKGFKIFYYHPIDDDSNGVWDELRKIEDLHVIHLKRRNALRTITSRRIARLQDIWQRSSDEPDAGRKKAVEISVSDAKERFLRIRAQEQGGDEMFEAHPLVRIYYEDLVADPEGTFGAVTDFLGVERSRPTTRLRKQNPESLQDLVTNYEELRSAFQGTEWETFFEE